MGQEEEADKKLAIAVMSVCNVWIARAVKGGCEERLKH
jgi:hypothetical protein